uniref:Uncharacterized protein n=1 Tax=Arundo donax TaxID=35708 RepID=A0A0A9GE25_ARUDO
MTVRHSSFISGTTADTQSPWTVTCGSMDQSTAAAKATCLSLNFCDYLSTNTPLLLNSNKKQCPFLFVPPNSLSCADTVPNQMQKADISA